MAALLLKEAGHEVVGLHACLWDSPRSERQAHQAESICSTLNIPFYVVDLKREFELYIVNSFCQEYKQGRTPNPCVICNQHIKFGFLLYKALSMGTDYLATGHYARIERLEDGYHLLKAKDIGISEGKIKGVGFIAEKGKKTIDAKVMSISLNAILSLGSSSISYSSRIFIVLLSFQFIFLGSNASFQFNTSSGLFQALRLSAFHFLPLFAHLQ